MKELLEKYKAIIASYEIVSWDSEPASYRFKARLIFVDGSQFDIRDYLFPTGRKYSFHWQDKDGNLVARWDNAMHWKNIDTFPHHKHEGDAVYASKEVILEEILEHIKNILDKSANNDIPHP